MKTALRVLAVMTLIVGVCAVAVGDPIPGIQRALAPLYRAGNAVGIPPATTLTGGYMTTAQVAALTRDSADPLPVNAVQPRTARQPFRVRTFAGLKTMLVLGTNGDSNHIVVMVGGTNGYGSKLTLNAGIDGYNLWEDESTGSVYVNADAGGALQYGQTDVLDWSSGTVWLPAVGGLVQSDRIRPRNYAAGLAIEDVNGEEVARFRNDTGGGYFPVGVHIIDMDYNAGGAGSAWLMNGNCASGIFETNGSIHITPCSSGTKTYFGGFNGFLPSTPSTSYGAVGPLALEAPAGRLVPYLPPNFDPESTDGRMDVVSIGETSHTRIRSGDGSAVETTDVDCTTVGCAFGGGISYGGASGTASYLKVSWIQTLDFTSYGPLAKATIDLTDSRANSFAVTDECQITAYQQSTNPVVYNCYIGAVGHVGVVQTCVNGTLGTCDTASQNYRITLTKW